MRRQRECNWFTLVVLCLKLTTARCQCAGSPLTVTASESPLAFTSPGYPTSYASNLYCEWLVDSGVAGQPVLLYSDNFNTVCTADNVTIYDGGSLSDQILLSSKCGTGQTSNIQSSSRYVLVTFTTDGSGSGQGFEMTYLSAADTSASGCSSEYVYTASTSAQYLTSPSFPAKYTASASCRWVLTAPGSSLSYITVELVWSDIEEDNNCAYDQLYIYDGAYICENTMLHVDCSARTAAGGAPVTLTSTSNSVLVIFTSDGSYNRYGFVLKYTATIITTTTLPPTSTTTLAGNASAALATGTSNTEKEVNIPLMFASALGGAAVSLLAVALVWRLKRLTRKKKKTKPGLMTVQAIAPLPPRSTFLMSQRHSPANRNALSFV